MDLTELTDKPQYSATIGGREYHFSELPVDSLASLQAWIKANTPHPVSAIKDYPEDISPEDRRYFLGLAYSEAKSWPPKIGTPDGARALFGTEAGQIESLYWGLIVHQPKATREDAKALYRELVAAKADGTIKAIVGVMFGLPVHEDEEEEEGDESSPKGPGAPGPSTGP